MKRQIIVDIIDDGEVKIETRGYQGRACVEEAQFLKDLLGTETARQLTPAYYQREGQRQTLKRHLPLCG
ncbi:MAG: hypothetical protein COT06_00445 [Syntrophobacteraceae bacterium CG07_land_8_20_14_0_80_61_8]|nr:MAG: hypothetical protein COT06_00445 [Syntrophobacteraceae bacterium CG07_land_8_20_14_0_80_61_8]